MPSTPQNPGQDPSSPPSNWFLVSFQALATSAGLSPPVTLNVQGVLVSGDLVDGKTYFDNLTSTSDEALKGLLPQPVINQFDALFATFEGRVNHPQGDGGQSDGNGPEPAHIYLRNARVVGPGGGSLPASGGVWWRVRLDAIDGFSLDLHASR